MDKKRVDINEWMNQSLPGIVEQLERSIRNGFDVQAEDVAQTKSHQFRFMIAPQPQELVGIIPPVTQLLQNLFRRLALAQTVAGHHVVNQIRRANRHLGQKLRTVEQHQHQFKQGRVAGPQFEQRHPRRIRADETGQPR